MTTIYTQIGEIIRELREKHPHSRGRLSQEELAGALGKPANTVSRWETGTYKTTPEDLDKLARFFKVPIATFFPDAEDMKDVSPMLTSALRGLSQEDLDEVIRYAQFRKVRHKLEARSTKKPT
jgi:transcriptional regulator with XRE-family HTH domain